MSKHFFRLSVHCNSYSEPGSGSGAIAYLRVVPVRFGSKRFSSIFSSQRFRFCRFAGSAGSPVQPVLKKVLFRKRCVLRFHAECTGHCVESFHEEPIREKNVIFKKVASWYPGIPVRGSASSLFSRFAGSHPFTGSPIRFASVFPVPGSRFRSRSEPCCD